MGFLCQIEADGSPGQWWQVGGTPLVVGRGDNADAQIDDDSLSRSHFLIVREHNEFFLVDLNSRNGTWLHGQPVAAGKLDFGETILAGQSLFRFSLDPLFGVTSRPVRALLPEISGAASVRRAA